METKVLTEMHIDAPVETVYGFLVDMENTNRIKASLMGDTIQAVEKTPDWVGTAYRMFRHLVGGLSYEFRHATSKPCRTSSSCRPPRRGSLSS